MGYQLSQDQVRSLRDAQRKLGDVIPDVIKAENCGMNCSEQKAAIDFLQERITATLREFSKPEGV